MRAPRCSVLLLDDTNIFYDLGHLSLEVKMRK